MIKEILQKEEDLYNGLYEVMVTNEEEIEQRFENEDLENKELEDSVINYEER